MENSTVGYSRFCASFRIIDAAALHAEVTSHLGPPSSSARKGDPLPYLKNGKGSHDMWVLDSPLPETSSWSDHLDWLDSRLGPHVEYLNTLKERDVKMDIFLGYRTDHDISEFQVSAGSTEIVSVLGIPLTISVIVA
jgi:hypothetical protein